MGVFRQLGDPLAAAACLCQHHGAAYCEHEPGANPIVWTVNYTWFAAGAVLVQCQIITTERCCIAVNAALATRSTVSQTDIEIERPLGTIRTTQEDIITIADMALMHHAAWEVLDAGTYTYYLVNRSQFGIDVMGAWLKIIASDCEG